MAATFKSRRLALAKYLEKNVTDAQYDHVTFGRGGVLHENEPRCAAGWAAVAGISGLYYDNRPDYVVILQKGNESTPIDLTLDGIFGLGTWRRIFSGVTSDIHTRQDAITALRNF